MVEVEEVDQRQHAGPQHERLVNEDARDLRHADLHVAHSLLAHFLVIHCPCDQRQERQSSGYILHVGHAVSVPRYQHGVHVDDQHGRRLEDALRQL